MTLRSIILVSLACGLAAALSATAPSMAARPEVDIAKKAVQRAVAALAQDLTSEDPAERKTARTALVQLSESVMTAVLTERKYPPAERKALADELFAGTVMAARQGQMLMSLPRGERRPVAQPATKAGYLPKTKPRPSTEGMTRITGRGTASRKSRNKGSKKD